MNKSLLIVLVALIACFALCAARTPRRASVESDLKLGKVLGKIGKGALKVGKAYVGQKYGIQLADEEEADKKIDFDEVFQWIGRGKQIYDLFKKDSEEEEVESDLKLGKIFNSIGKGALKVGKAYVGQKYGIQLSDEELADKKITIDDIFEFIEKGKKIHDILKGSGAEEEADKLNLDEIFGYVAKGKQIFDIFKSFKKQKHAPAAEVESDLKIGKLLGKIGKGALKVGKAYVGQKYGIQLSDEEIASDLKLGKALKKIGKGALKVGKAYVGQKYGINLADELADKKINLDEIFGWVSKGKQIYDIFKSFKKQPAVETESDSMNGGSTAASFARSQVGKGYSQAARLGPNSFDCSGLVKMAWQQAGRSVPNTTSGYPGGLRQVSLSSIQTGDILWRSGHVGIYVGNGQVVNAENPRSGVQIRSLDWYQRYMGVSAVYRP